MEDSRADGGPRQCLLEMDHACGEVGFNTFETRNAMRYPAGDVMNQVARGPIYKDWNAGLRNPQAKKLTVDVYNSGCEDVFGCVNGSDHDGYGCGKASRKVASPEMDRAYAYLNAPYMQDGYEYVPPRYMMGIKDSGPNSVDGWNRTASGATVWAEQAQKQHPGKQSPGGNGCG